VAARRGRLATCRLAAADTPHQHTNTTSFKETSRKLSNVIRKLRRISRIYLSLLLDKEEENAVHQGSTRPHQLSRARHRSSPGQQREKQHPKKSFLRSSATRSSLRTFLLLLPVFFLRSNVRPGESNETAGSKIAERKAPPPF